MITPCAAHPALVDLGHPVVGLVERVVRVAAARPVAQRHRGRHAALARMDVAAVVGGEQAQVEQVDLDAAPRSSTSLRDASRGGRSWTSRPGSVPSLRAEPQITQHARAALRSLLPLLRARCSALARLAATRPTARSPGPCPSCPASRAAGPACPVWIASSSKTSSMPRHALSARVAALCPKLGVGLAYQAPLTPLFAPTPAILDLRRGRAGHPLDRPRPGRRRATSSDPDAHAFLEQRRAAQADRAAQHRAVDRQRAPVRPRARRADGALAQRLRLPLAQRPPRVPPGRARVRGRGQSRTSRCRCRSTTRRSDLLAARVSRGAATACRCRSCSRTTSTTSACPSRSSTRRRS